MKSACGKRPPDEANGPGKVAIKPQQLCLREQRQESAHVHAALSADVGTTLIQKMEACDAENGARKVQTANCSASTSKNCKKSLFFISYIVNPVNGPYCLFSAVSQILVQRRSSENAK